MRRTFAMITVVLLQAAAAMASGTVIADFEDLVLAPDSYWRGDAVSAGFTSGVVDFQTNYAYIAEWGMETWDGFAYSNVSDATTPGFGNQFASVTGSGVGGGGIYSVAWDPVPSFAGSAPRLALTDTATGYTLDGAYFTNTTYSYLSMRDGDAFAKKFGGFDGSDPDYLLLTITGLTPSGPGSSMEFYLADFRAAADEDDYILTDWTWVDLSGLGPVTGLEFAVSGTDMGTFGLNTPAYFAMDNLIVPEPTTLALLTLGGAAILPRRRK